MHGAVAELKGTPNRVQIDFVPPPDPAGSDSGTNERCHPLTSRTNEHQHSPEMSGGNVENMENEDQVGVGEMESMCFKEQQSSSVEERIRALPGGASAQAPVIPTGSVGRLGTQAPPRAVNSQDSEKKKFKWDVKPGGSFVPQVPSVVQRAAEERDREQHTHQRKWEVKFAPQLATASRRTLVMTSEVKDYIDQMTKNSESNQLRTAVGGGGGGGGGDPATKR